jgi:hypothetical protein
MKTEQDAKTVSYMKLGIVLVCYALVEKYVIGDRVGTPIVAVAQEFKTFTTTFYPNYVKLPIKPTIFIL